MMRAAALPVLLTDSWRILCVHQLKPFEIVGIKMQEYEIEMTMIDGNQAGSRIKCRKDQINEQSIHRKRNSWNKPEKKYNSIIFSPY